jgi:hypothetical protein
MQNNDLCYIDSCEFSELNKNDTLLAHLAERFLQSLGFRLLSSVSRRPSYVFTFESSPLKVLGQTEPKLGREHGRPSIKIVYFVPIR